MVGDGIHLVFHKRLQSSYPVSPSFRKSLKTLSAVPFEGGNDLHLLERFRLTAGYFEPLTAVSFGVK